MVLFQLLKVLVVDGRWFVVGGKQTRGRQTWTACSGRGVFDPNGKRRKKISTDQSQIRTSICTVGDCSCMADFVFVIVEERNWCEQERIDKKCAKFVQNGSARVESVVGNLPRDSTQKPFKSFLFSLLAADWSTRHTSSATAQQHTNT